MDNWNNLHITDKSGSKFYNTIASQYSTPSEIKNLKQHLEQAKKYPHLYKFLDIDTATIMLNDQPYTDKPFVNKLTDLDNDLLDQLF